MAGKTGRPYYRNAEDTLADVGISQRQLGYWRKHELFTPELGTKSKYFTEEDTSRLRFLKNLIEELGLPIATVTRLLASAEPRISLFGGKAQPGTFLDIENGKLVGSSTALDELMAQHAVHGGTYALEEALKIIALELFHQMWIKSKTSDIYDAHYKDLMWQIRRMDLMTRIRFDDDHVWFAPKRENDPTYTMEQAEQLVAERDRLRKRVKQIKDSTWDDLPF